MNEVTVAKFGGTSLADAAQIEKALNIIRADPRRRHIVVSAPGKRENADDKITDLLYGLLRGMENRSAEQILGIIAHRFNSIIAGLSVSLDLAPHIDALRRAMRQRDLDFVASRGEYLSAMILAEALGYEFIDAAQVIRFDASGRLDMEKSRKSRDRLRAPASGYVIPGFYGSMPDGSIKTLARGGSDLTGAVVAAIVEASVYENWTDVSGLRMTDPRIVPRASRIDTVTYKELRELAYRGARVLHDEVIFPLRKAGIPIVIRNTNRPDDPGTSIVPDHMAPSRKVGSIVGIAGRTDFTIITVEKTLMNQEVGFVRKVCGVLERHTINIEHIPGGIDTLSVVVASESLRGSLESVKAELERECAPDNLVVSPGLALICTVGHSMVRSPGVAAKLLQAVASANINVRMIDQGSSELSIIIGVENDDYEKAVRAIYHAFAA